MKRNYLKRTMALAVAAAMTVSSVPVDMVFAEEIVVDETAAEAMDAAEEVWADETLADASVDEGVMDVMDVTEDAAVSEEAPAEEPSVAAEVTAEDEVVLEGLEAVASEEVPDAVQEDVAEALAEVTGGLDEVTYNAQAPAQITNVAFDKDNKDRLTWYGNDVADKYQISITDAAGNEYKVQGEGHLEYTYEYYVCETVYYSYDYNEQTEEFDIVYHTKEEYENDENNEIYSSLEKKTIDCTEEEYWNRIDAGEDIYRTCIGEEWIQGEADYYTTESLYADLSSLILSAFKANSEESAENVYWNTPGTSYTIKVRGWNQNDVNTADTVIGYGPWSAPVTYTAEAVKLDKVADIKVEKDILSFDYTSGASLEMSVVDNKGYEYYYYTTTDKDGKTVGVYSNPYSGMKLEPDMYSLCAYTKNSAGELEPVKVGEEYLRAFAVGTTYKIKVRAYTGDIYDGTKKTGEWSDEVTYTPAENAKPEKTGNLKYDEDSEEISWNRVEDAEYEIEVKDAAGNHYYNYVDYDYENGVEKKVPVNYSTSGTSMYVGNDEWLTAYTSAGEEVKDAKGQTLKAFAKGRSYTVSVKPYNYNKKGDKQYAEAAVLTFTVPAPEKAPAPQKVTGVTVINGRVKWNSEVNADQHPVDYYEVSVKDGSNRAYQILVTDETTGKNVLENAKVSGTSAYLAYLNTYVSVDGGYVVCKDPKTGEEITAFSEEGQTYYVQVRAVRMIDGKEVAGAWSGTAKYSIPKESLGNNTKPAAVTGLTIKTAADADDDIYAPELHWNSIEKASGYELMIKDAAGNVYTEGLNREKNYEPIYPDAYTADNFPSVYLSEFTWLQSYVKADGVAMTTVKDADGNPLKAFSAGKTYSIQVRAYNVYDGEKIYGDWSAAVSYAVPALAAITDLKYVSADEDYYYFSYSAKVNSGYVFYQVAKDAAFTAASLVKDWNHGFTPGENKLAISKTASYLEAGKTYYIRALISEEAPEKEDVAKLAPKAISFTAEKVAKTPKNITGLKLEDTVYGGWNWDDEDEESYYQNGYYEFSFAGVLEADKDSYELEYKDSASSDYVIVGQTTRLSMDSLHEGAVNVRVRAYIYDENGSKVYGAYSNVVTVNYSKATTVISNLAIAEKTQSGYVFTFTGGPLKDEEVEYWISRDSKFATNDREITGFKPSDNGYQFEIPYTELTPGSTYFVRARVRNNGAEKEEDRYSAYTNTVAIVAEMPKIYVYGTDITSTSVTLRMSVSSNEEYLTGYQIQRKSGKKYQTLVKTTNDSYKDTGLKKDTTYTYRVRSYYVNAETKKTVYGDWKTYQAMTWGGALKLKAKAASKSSVKLTWSKISGASGYEVYRRVTSSGSATAVKGEDASYAKYTLVKKLKKSAKSYTNKKLTGGMTYEYMVRAYKTVGKKKYYISDYAYVNMEFGSFYLNENNYYTAAGKYVINWSPIYAADGYLIEKYDEDAEKWITVTKLAKSKSTYTFPAASEETVRYRIRAYKGKAFTNAAEVYVTPQLAAPTGVKAVANAANNSITVSWKPVAGADYYAVYRTTSSRSTYDKTTGAYSHVGGKYVPVYVANEAKVSGYEKLDEDEVTMTSIVDRGITYTANGVTNTLCEAPQAGVTYYYYVVAYKKGTAVNYEDNYENGRSGWASKAAGATITSTKVAKASVKKVTAGKKKVTVTWKKVSGAAGYEVYRSAKKSSGYTKIAVITKGSTVKYVDKTAKKGKRYYYKVRAFKYNEAGATVFGKNSTAKRSKKVK